MFIILILKEYRLVFFYWEGFVGGVDFWGYLRLGGGRNLLEE